MRIRLVLIALLLVGAASLSCYQFEVYITNNMAISPSTAQLRAYYADERPPAYRTINLPGYQLSAGYLFTLSDLSSTPFIAVDLVVGNTTYSQVGVGPSCSFVLD